jgi:hypothetical protein
MLTQTVQAATTAGHRSPLVEATVDRSRASWSTPCRREASSRRKEIWQRPRNQTAAARPGPDQPRLADGGKPPASHL